MPGKRSNEKAAAPPASATVPGSPDNAAKNAIDDLFSSPAPPPIKKIRAQRTGDSNFTALCKVHGVVLRATDVSRPGKEGTVTKKRSLEVVITGIVVNGSSDCIRSDVGGENFLLPSKAVEVDGAKTRAREVVVEDYQRCRKLSHATFELFKEPGTFSTPKPGAPAGNANGAPNKDVPGVNACVPGSQVEISGVMANIANGKNGESVYLNASSATPIASSDVATDATLAAHLMLLNSTPKMQEWSAFGASKAADGFFNTSGLNPAQLKQAEACQTLWKRVTENVADRLDVMTGGKPDADAELLAKHASRIRGMAPSTLANGQATMFIAQQYDKTIAPAMQTGVSPWDRKPAIVRKLTSDDPSGVPDAFAALTTNAVEVHGDLLSIEMGAACVFDKEAALEAIDIGAHSPFLVVPHALAYSISMKVMATHIGCMGQEKATFGAKEILPFAEEASFPCVSNCDGSQMASDFPIGGTKFIDFPRTLQKVGVLVGEGWLKTNMCGGGVQFIPPSGERAQFNLPDKHNGEMPFLEKNWYQEMTSKAFDLDDIKGLDKKTGRRLEYRIVYEGVTADLAANKELASDAATGEAHVDTAIASDEDDSLNSPKKWLAAKALVYAILA